MEIFSSFLLFIYFRITHPLKSLQTFERMISNKKTRNENSNPSQNTRRRAKLIGQTPHPLQQLVIIVTSEPDASYMTKLRSSLSQNRIAYILQSDTNRINMVGLQLKSRIVVIVDDLAGKKVLGGQFVNKDSVRRVDYPRSNCLQNVIKFLGQYVSSAKYGETLEQYQQSKNSGLSSGQTTNYYRAHDQQNTQYFRAENSDRRYSSTPHENEQKFVQNAQSPNKNFSEIKIFDEYGHIKTSTKYNQLSQNKKEPEQVILPLHPRIGLRLKSVSRYSKEKQMPKMGKRILFILLSQRQSLQLANYIRQLTNEANKKVIPIKSLEDYEKKYLTLDEGQNCMLVGSSVGSIQLDKFKNLSEVYVYAEDPILCSKLIGGKIKYAATTEKDLNEILIREGFNVYKIKILKPPMKWTQSVSIEASQSIEIQKNRQKISQKNIQNALKVSQIKIKLSEQNISFNQHQQSIMIGDRILFTSEKQVQRNKTIKTFRDDDSECVSLGQIIRMDRMIQPLNQFHQNKSQPNSFTYHEEQKLIEKPIDLGSKVSIEHLPTMHPEFTTEYDDFPKQNNSPSQVIQFESAYFVQPVIHYEHQEDKYLQKQGKQTFKQSQDAQKQNESETTGIRKRTFTFQSEQQKKSDGIRQRSPTFSPNENIGQLNGIKNKARIQLSGSPQKTNFLKPIPESAFQIESNCSSNFRTQQKFANQQNAQMDQKENQVNTNVTVQTIQQFNMKKKSVLGSFSEEGPRIRTANSICNPYAYSQYTNGSVQSPKNQSLAKIDLSNYDKSTENGIIVYRQRRPKIIESISANVIGHNPSLPIINARNPTFYEYEATKDTSSTRNSYRSDTNFNSTRNQNRKMEIDSNYFHVVNRLPKELQSPESSKTIKRDKSNSARSNSMFQTSSLISSSLSKTSRNIRPEITKVNQNKNTSQIKQFQNQYFNSNLNNYGYNSNLTTLNGSTSKRSTNTNISYVFYKDFNKQIRDLAKIIKKYSPNSHFRKYYNLSDLPSTALLKGTIIFLFDQINFEEMLSYCQQQEINNSKILKICLPKSPSFIQLYKYQDRQEDIIWLIEHDLKDHEFLMKRIFKRIAT